MCGRFTLRTPANELVGQFQLETMPELQPRYNISPTPAVPIVRTTQESPRRQMTFARWGLVPSWAKELAIGNRMINARGETVAEKPSFRTPFRRRRCLVIADGYYEWKKIEGRKQPFYIRLRDERPFAFAGLWDTWRGPRDDPLDEPLETCTIITTESSESIRRIHDRMPVILDPDSYEMWMDPLLCEPGPIQPLLQPYAADEIIVDPVSTHVNKPTNEGTECIVPIKLSE